MLYTYSDAQGSLVALTDVDGNLVRRYAYDQWGARRDADNWNAKDNCAHLVVNRGYTGHEHLDAFGIINMNGRVYDPATGMFFSPDPTVTDAGNWLDYNRYSYCLNNPFRYTDPSGYSWWAENWQSVITTVSSIIVTGVVGILTCGVGASAIIASGMMAGAAGGFTGGFVGTVVSGGSFSDAMGAEIQGAVPGAYSGAITAGIGVGFGNVGSIVNELERAGAHALAQGAFSAIRGGNFWQGAASGFVSSLGGSASGALGITDFTGTVAVTSAMGGLGAALGGARNTEDILFGMASGAMIGALNFAEHEIVEVEEKTLLDKAIIAAGFNPDDVAKWTNAEITANIAKIFPELYKAANSPTFETKDMTDWGQTPYDIITQNGQTTTKFSGVIYLRNAALNTVRIAATVAGHELCHAIDHVNGFFNSFLHFGINIAKAFTEVHAYSWEINMGSPLIGPNSQLIYQGYLNTVNNFKNSITQ